MRRLLPLLLALCLALPALAGEQPATLAQGSRGEEVSALQKRLIELRLLDGKADGLYGPKTAEAVKRFQLHLSENGYRIAADGAAGPETLRLIYDDEAAGSLLDLKAGDQGARVSALQAALYDLRLLDELPDGVYGPATARAVRAFQEALVASGVEGARLSGEADALTRKSLFGDMKGLGLRVPQTFDDTRPEALTADDLYAKSALLIDAGTGRDLLAKEAETRRYPASTTKIMTLLLALEGMDLKQTVTIPAQARQIPPDSSQVPVFEGEQMPLADLLYGLMIRSGNDAANAVAVLHSGSLEAFAERMNERAKQLGMAGTHFVNPHGYQAAGHYTTAADLARLTLEALKNEDFRAIAGSREYTMKSTALRAALPIRLSTELLDPSSPFYYPGAFGVKSGYTRAAGFCYVGCAEKDGRLLLAVIMNARTRNQAWTDMRRLFELGFAK